MALQVTILGCGLSGMLSALCYADCGIETTIITASALNHPSFFADVRTTAITSSSKKILEKFGIWTELKEYAGTINDIYVADNKAPAMLHFSADDIQKNEVMGYLIENNIFKKCLLNLVQNNQYIRIISQTDYEIITNEDLMHELLLNNKIQHKSDLLIICDGKYSLAKQKFFSPLINKTYNQQAITFVTEHEKPHESIAVEHFMPSGPFAILPLKSPHRSSIVWTIDEKTAPVIMNLPLDEFTYIIQQNIGHFLGKINIASEIAAFPLKAYITKQYFNKNIVLVADSAHIIHPLAGQGLNQGIKDIEVLINMSLIYNDVEQALSYYERLRKKDNIHMLKITDNINRIFSNNSKLFHFFRQLGFQTIESLPWSKKMLIKYGMGKR